MAKPAFKILLIVMSAFGGTFSNFGFKAQNSVLVYQGPFYKPFFHPYMQMMSIFLSMFICLIPFAISIWWNPLYYQRQMIKAEKKGKIINMNKYLLAVPALCDFVSATLDSAGLNFIDPSAYYMLRGGTMITTILFTKLMTVYSIKKREVYGIITVLAGIIISGTANVVFTDQDAYGSTKVQKIIGYLLIVITLFFDGFGHVFEGELINKYYLHPLLAVGFQGLFGLWVSLLLLPLVNFIPCNFSTDACTYNQHGQGFLQKPLVYLQSIMRDKYLMWFCLMSLVGYSFNYSIGVYVTKYINALARPLVQLMETIFIWALGLALTLIVGQKYPNFAWQTTDIRAIGFMIFGFGLIVLGNFVYSGVVRLTEGEQDNIENESDIQSQSDDSQQNRQNLQFKNEARETKKGAQQLKQI